MLSVITAGRIDDYEGDFVGRLIESVHKNCSLLSKLGVDYQYTIVEWNPINKFIKNHERTSELFNNKEFNINGIIIDQSVVNAENLNPNKYYEYFAKNAGIKRAEKTNTLIINSDTYMSEKMAEVVAKISSTPIPDNIFYRARYRNGSDLHNPFLHDADVCGSFSGDFLMCNTSVIQNKIKGYDETNPNHRIGYQTAMDGEILYQMKRHGMSMKFVEENYIHINHGKNRVYDSGDYNQNGYENKPDWGFSKYNTKSEDRLSIIYA